MARSRTTAIAAALVAGMLSVAGVAACGTPSPESFRDQSDKALEDATSTVATTELVLDQLHDRKLPSTYGTVVVTMQEEELGSTQQTYTSSRPPLSAQAVFDSTSALLESAASTVTEARIAVQRGRRGEYAEIATRLGDTAAQIEQARTRLRVPAEEGS